MTKTSMKGWKVRDMHFPSLQSIADHFNVALITVQKRAQLGKLDDPYPCEKTIEYEGKSYSSVKELAFVLGVKPNTVVRARSHGTMATLGKGKTHD